jgi:hypothetical protein
VHLPPISDKGKLTIEPVDVAQVWWDVMTKDARSAWRADPLHNIDKENGRGEHSEPELNEQMVQEKLKWCYTPDAAELEAEQAEDEFKGGVVSVSGNARKEGQDLTAVDAVKDVLTALGVVELEKFGKLATRTLGIDRIAARLPHFSVSGTFLKRKSKYMLENTEKMTKEDIEADMYSIYLTAISASYEEEHEEGKISASAFHHLCASNARGLDYIMSLKNGAEGSVTGAIIEAHSDLKAHLDSLKVSADKISPPIHKLQTIVEAFFVEFEVHESVEKYLGRHLGGELTALGAEIHERICKECREVAEDSLLNLAKHAYAQHTIMPVVHSFLVFRHATTFMKSEMKALKTHGLMSSACYNGLMGELSKRAQEAHAVISDDGATSKMMECRDWIGMRCCKKAHRHKDQHLTAAQVAAKAELHKAAFSNLDADHSGNLTRDELKAALDQLGKILTPEEFAGIFQHADKDGDGVIDFKEFMMLSSSTKSLQTTTLAEAKYLREKHRAAAAAVQGKRRETAADSLAKVRMALPASAPSKSAELPLLTPRP